MTARLAMPILLLALASGRLLRADLAQVKAEPNLEKRSKLALDNAGGPAQGGALGIRQRREREGGSR